MSSTRTRQHARSVADRRLTSRVRIFLSYAHRDEKLRNELDKHLSPLRRSALVDAWHDRRIMPGGEIDREIDQHLVSADLILLLISPDFINSDYCYCKEMRTALRRHAKGLARVIPVILRPVDWAKTPIGRLLATPKDGKPVISWHRRDEALLDVARSVRRAAEELNTAQQSSRIAVKEPSVSMRSRWPRAVSAAKQQSANKRGRL